MDYNTPSARESLTRKDAFGERLESDINFELKSPFSYTYNCIAFAMGMDDRWVDCADLPWHWWPPVNKGMEDADLIGAFRYFGFEECGMDDSIEKEYDKVALYHNANGWTHAARVVDDGIYHSKFGASYDGIHSRGDVLQAQYGKPYIIMRRLKTETHLTDDLKGIAPGVIHTKIQVDIDGRINHIIVYKGKTFLGDFGCEVQIVGDRVKVVNT